MFYPFVRFVGQSVYVAYVLNVARFILLFCERKFLDQRLPTSTSSLSLHLDLTLSTTFTIKGQHNFNIFFVAAPAIVTSRNLPQEHAANDVSLATGYPQGHRPVSLASGQLVADPAHLVTFDHLIDLQSKGLLQVNFPRSVFQGNLGSKKLLLTCVFVKHLFGNVSQATK